MVKLIIGDIMEISVVYNKLPKNVNNSLKLNSNSRKLTAFYLWDKILTSQDRSIENKDCVNKKLPVASFYA